VELKEKNPRINIKVNERENNITEGGKYEI